MALVNIERVWQLDAVQRQVTANEISAQFGSIAFMYAKHVYKGHRTLESLQEPYLSQVPLIFDYIIAHGYQQVLS